MDSPLPSVNVIEFYRCIMAIVLPHALLLLYSAPFGLKCPAESRKCLFSFYWLPSLYRT